MRLAKGVATEQPPLEPPTWAWGARAVLGGVGNSWAASAEEGLTGAFSGVCCRCARPCPDALTGSGRVGLLLLPHLKSLSLASVEGAMRLGEAKGLDVVELLESMVGDRSILRSQ